MSVERALRRSIEAETYRELVLRRLARQEREAFERIDRTTSDKNSFDFHSSSLERYRDFREDSSPGWSDSEQRPHGGAHEHAAPQLPFEVARRETPRDHPNRPPSGSEACWVSEEEEADEDVPTCTEEVDGVWSTRDLVGQVSRILASYGREEWQALGAADAELQLSQQRVRAQASQPSEQETDGSLGHNKEKEAGARKEVDLGAVYMFLGIVCLPSW